MMEDSKMKKEKISKESKTRKVSSLKSEVSLFVTTLFVLFLLSTILSLSITCDGLPESESDEKGGERGQPSSMDTSSNKGGEGGSNRNPRQVALPLRSSSSSSGAQKITFGAILPATALTTIKRAYNKRIADTVESITKGKDVKFNFISEYVLAYAQVVLVSLNPSPNEVLHTLCNQLLTSNITTVIYMTNSDVYVQNTASAQYLMQLTGYLGIPMIAWNADNIGLEQRASESRILQLAPSVEHQAAAMLGILTRYSWHVFSIITSNIGGHGDFVRAVRDQISSIDNFKFTILDILTINTKYSEDIISKVELLSKSEARVMLLYCSKGEAQRIMSEANKMKLTGKNYIWIVTQSVVGTASEYHAPGDFPPGMLGIYFNTTHLRMLEEIEKAVTVIGYGLESFHADKSKGHINLSPKLSCSSTAETRWKEGDLFFQYLRNVSIKQTKYHNRPDIEFKPDGTLKFVELDIVNLNRMGNWEKIGVWTEDGLEIKDITWPENSPVPPAGVPEKFSLKVTFLDEPSFVRMNDPDNETGECKTSRAVRCRFAPEHQLIGVNKTLAYRDPRYYRCCSGFCIDLLQKFADDLKFSYELNRVEDGTWGALNNGTWNGLIAELLNQKADIVVTSIKINSDRQAYVDFTVPFLETGITIVVAKKTGIISPKAFLEPFDTISWIMILLVSIQVAAFAIFFFEWLSPSGYDMQLLPQKDHKFSLFRTYWLVWAILFGAAVPVNCPRGYTSRFMSNVWATFAVVFLAIYTANLAAFMITREDYHDFSGIEDPRLVNAEKLEPALRFGTIPYGNTEAVLKRNKPRMHMYMKRYNRSTSWEGVKAVKRNELDAFIYDAVVLDYLTGLDSECRLLTVGSWYAMTGYGFALPKKSKYLQKFNEKMIEYRESGDLERLRKFWFQGACKPSKSKGKLSKPLDVNQFMSAFLLLGCGILLTILLLALEHCYFRSCRKRLAKADTDGCFTLVSLSMATSLNLPDTTDGSDGDGARRRKSLLAIQNRSSLCTDPNCDTKLLRMRQELQLTKLKLKQLEHLSRKQQLQLQGRLNLSNDITQMDGKGENSRRNFFSFEESSSSSSKCKDEVRTRGRGGGGGVAATSGVGRKRQVVVVKDDSAIKSRTMKKDKVSNVLARPKSSLAFVQFETVI